MYDILIREGRKGSYTWKVINTVATVEIAKERVACLKVERPGHFYTWAKQGEY